MSNSEQLDPVYRHSLREAWVILALWGLSFIWTVPYCYLYGYRSSEQAAELPITLGLPAWVVWGVGVPWLVTGVIAILLCLFFIQNDELGHSQDEVPDHENAAVGGLD